MARRDHEQNEAAVLYFRREKLTDGVHMARVALRRGENSLFHRHTRTRDTFYVMSGTLTITLHLDGSDGPAGYHAVCETKPEVKRDRQGRHVHRVTVQPGEVVVIEPGVLHCAANAHDSPCHFLCIEGVGEYDFVEEPVRA